jgi:hypothetical protein
MRPYYRRYCPYHRPENKEGYRRLPPYSGPQVVRLLGRLLTLALVLSLPLLLALLALHLAGYLPAPAPRPRHAMVQSCARDSRETRRTCRTWSTTLVADPVAANRRLRGARASSTGHVHAVPAVTATPARRALLGALLDTVTVTARHTAACVGVDRGPADPQCLDQWQRGRAAGRGPGGAGTARPGAGRPPRVAADLRCAFSSCAVSLMTGGAAQAR